MYKTEASNSVSSMIDIAFHTIGYKKSAVMLVVAKDAKGNVSFVHMPRTVSTSKYFATSNLLFPFELFSKFNISFPTCLSYN